VERVTTEWGFRQSWKRERAEGGNGKGGAVELESSGERCPLSHHEQAWQHKLDDSMTPSARNAGGMWSMWHRFAYMGRGLGGGGGSGRIWIVVVEEGEGPRWRLCHRLVFRSRPVRGR